MHQAGGSKNILGIELNEFNVPLLTAATKQHSLPAIAKVLAFPQTQYRTDDRYHSGYLEPWVQWVTIHAGVPSSKHQIKHLGDVPALGFAQCWETLSKAGITSGVWGVMNGARRQSEHVKFFLPDPWTFSELGYPSELNNLLDLPRYLSKNYKNLSKKTILYKAIKILKFIATSNTCSKILFETTKLLFFLARFGNKHFVYISYFDLISTLLFIQYKQKYNPRCSFIFLNSLAHLQHHHWRQGTTTSTPEILHGLQMIDKILTLLFNTFGQDAIIVHNGLSQMNTNHEKPWVLYRQKDPENFLQALNLKAIRVEQHMTHDGHAFFATPEDCQHAFEQLTHLTLLGKPLFHIEKNPHDAHKLFYMLSFTDDLEISDQVQFEFNGKKIPFFQYFDKIVTRTGRHTPIGTIFSNIIEFPDNIYNHDFNKYLYHYLLPTTAESKICEPI